MSVRISADRLARIRQSAREVPPATSRKNKEAELTRRSAARVAGWSNTLEAVRRNKEKGMADRAARLEAQRQQIDDDERARKQRERDAALKRAHDLIYAETDRMKTFRSHKITAETVHDRGDQKSIKLRQAAMEKKLTAHWLGVSKREMAKIDAKNAAKAARVKESYRETAAMQKHQRAGFNTKVVQRLLQEKREGELIVAKSARDYLEDVGKDEDRKRHARMIAFEMMEANADLKLRRKVAAEEAARLDAQDKAYAASRDDLKRRRKLHVAKMTAEKQATVQRMIDRAVENLRLVTNTEDARQARQADEIEAKKVASLAAKEAKLQALRDACHNSRQSQIARKRREREMQTASDAELAAVAKRKNEEAIQAAKDKLAFLKKRDIAHEAALKVQIEETFGRRDTEKVEDIATAKALQAANDAELGAFYQHIQGEIVKAAANGVDTEILARSLVPRNELKGFVWTKR
jgi:hypothetical protein